MRGGLVKIISAIRAMVRSRPAFWRLGALCRLFRLLPCGKFGVLFQIFFITHFNVPLPRRLVRLCTLSLYCRRSVLTCIFAPKTFRFFCRIRMRMLQLCRSRATFSRRAPHNWPCLTTRSRSISISAVFSAFRYRR